MGSRKGFPHTGTERFFGFLSDDRRFGYSPKLHDLERRARGLIAALDCVLARRMGWETPTEKLIANEAYLPLPIQTWILVKDPQGDQRRLLDLIQQELPAMAQAMPEIHHDPGLDEAFKVRAAMLLRSMNPTPETAETVRRMLQDLGTPGAQSAWAIFSATLGDDTEAHRLLTQGQDSLLTLQMLGALSSGPEKAYWHPVGDAHSMVWSPYRNVAVSLDGVIAGLATGSEDPTIRRAAAIALVPRLENPVAREAVLGYLRSERDPEAIYDVLRRKPALQGSMEFRDLLFGWVRGEDEPLRRMAEYRLAFVPDGRVVDHLLGKLRSEDASVRCEAAGLLSLGGIADPRRVLDIMNREVQRTDQDKEYLRACYEAIYYTRYFLNSAEEDRAWLKDHPEHVIPR